MKSYSELEYLKIFNFQNILLLNKLIEENNLSLLSILSKQILMSQGFFDSKENYFKSQFQFQFLEEYELIKQNNLKNIEYQIYSKVPVFVIYELNKVIGYMNSGDYSFDDTPEKIESIIKALKNDNATEAAEAFNKTDQYTRSYFSDSFMLYFKYILSTF